MKRMLLLVVFLLANPCWGDCVLHYKMNDNAESTTVIDIAGTSDGTAQQNTENLHADSGNPPYLNGALTFNGSSDYINTNSTLQSVLQNDFSVNFWCRPDDGRPPSVQCLVASDWDIQDSYVGATLTTTGRIRGRYRVGGYSVVVLSSYVFSDGPQLSWTMVTLTAKQITPAITNLSLYINGSLEFSENSAGLIMSDYTSADQIHIGYVNAAATYFAGDIDNVMIFDEALSADKVERLYNNGDGTEMPCFLEGDLNQDCRVDLSDFAMLALYWRESNCGACGGADLDDDEDVDFNDLKKLADNWLEEQPWPVE